MVVAFVLIMSKTGHEREVLNELNRLNEVKEASIVFGDYDIIAKLEASDMAKINEVLLNRIRKIPNVSMTTTLIGF